MEGDKEIAALGDWPGPDIPLFVKPNTLGAKIGIFADSLCRDRLEVAGEAYRCAPCARTYPLHGGIPDFRVFPDPYLSPEEDRERIFQKF